MDVRDLLDLERGLVGGGELEAATQDEHGVVWAPDGGAALTFLEETLPLGEDVVGQLEDLGSQLQTPLGQLGKAFQLSHDL